MGVDDNSLANAQYISDPVADLGRAAGPQRGAVLGQTDSGTGSASTPDYYSFSVSAGETDSLVVANQSAGNLTLDLLDGNGTVLDSGVGAANLSEAISKFTFSTAGLYYVRISGDANVPYSLVIIRNAVFDTEPNDTPAAAQSIDGTQGALGAIASASDADWYSISVTNTSTVLRLATSTPSDGTGQFTNVLNPQIDLFDPSGNMVASGVVGTDGRNESIQYRPLVNGAYHIRVTGESGTTGEYFLSSQLSLSGDVNQDGTVNGLDIALVAGDWLNIGSDPADANGDGIVNGLDIALISSQWLQSLPAGVLAAVRSQARRPRRFQLQIRRLSIARPHSSAASMRPRARRPSIASCRYLLLTAISGSAPGRAHRFNGQPLATSSTTRATIDETLVSLVDDDLLETLATGNAQRTSLARSQG